MFCVWAPKVYLRHCGRLPENKFLRSEKIYEVTLMSECVCVCVCTGDMQKNSHKNGLLWFLFGAWIRFLTTAERFGQ